MRRTPGGLVRSSACFRSSGTRSEGAARRPQPPRGRPCAGAAGPARPSRRARVRSYFQEGSSDTRAGIRQMASRVETIETIVTQNEVEALHLEQNLVKRHRPPFNVRLRDDKSFPYIAFTVEDDYPRVMFTRERHRRGVVYFGPYANAKKVRETLDVLNRV